MAEMMIQNCYSSKISVYILKWVGVSASEYNGFTIETEKYLFFGFSTKQKKNTVAVSTKSCEMVDRFFFKEKL